MKGGGKVKNSYKKKLGWRINWFWNNPKTLKQRLAYRIWSYCAKIRAKVKPHI